MKIEYYVDSGKQGGCEGLSFDTKDNTVYYSHAAQEKLSIDNADDVQWAIDGAIKELKTEIKRLKKKLALKADVKERIDGGYRLIQKPTAKMSEIIREKIRLAEKEIAQIEALDVMKMVGDI